MKKHKLLKKILSSVFVVILLFTSMPTTFLKEARASAETQMMDSVVLFNDGFENGLANWNDYGSDCITASDSVFQTGQYSLAITGKNASASYIRREVESVSAGTEYTLTYAVNTGASVAVKAVVYEYSFHNKIVGKHETAVYGPSAETQWKQGKLTFTTSELADKLGVVLITDGWADTVFIDDVVLVANEEEVARVHYDDYNGNGIVNVADLVRMKRVYVKDTEVQLAKERYADRDGNGAFENVDIGGFRKKLAGNTDEFASVIATGDAAGAKLESEDWAYLTTGKAYTNQTFVATTAIHDKTGEKPLTIGMRIGEATSSPDEAEGLKAAIQNDQIIFSSDAWNDTITKDFALVEGETYLLSANISDQDDGAKTVLVVARQDSQIVASAECVLDASHAAAIPASGFFVVWSGSGAQDIFYQTVQDAAETAVTVPENSEDGVVMITNPDEANDNNRGYLFVEGDYTSEVFEFTTKYDPSYGIIAGLHESAASAAWENQGNGIRVLFNSWGIAVRTYLGNIIREEVVVNYHTLDGSIVGLLPTGEYTFKIQMMGNDLHVVIEKEGKLYTRDVLTLSGVDQFLEIGTTYTVPTSGAYCVWKAYTDGNDKEVAYKMPYKDTTSVNASEAAGEVLLTTKEADDKTQSAYVTLPNIYVAKVLEATTMLTDSDNGNLQLGVHMEGVTNNPNAKDGLVVQIEKDHFAVYKNGAQVGENVEWENALSARKAYTFRVGVIDTMLVVRVLEDGVTLNDKTVDVSAVSFSASGYMAVWSQDAYREVDYQVVSGGEYATILSAPTEGGQVWLTNTNMEDPRCGARLHATGTYSTGIFSVTTVANESTATFPNLVLGARMQEHHPNYHAVQGVVVHCYTNFFEIYMNLQTGVVDSTWIAAYNYNTPDGGIYTLQNGETYTFAISVSPDNVLTLTLEQDGTLISQNTHAFDSSQNIPIYGGFCVWSRTEDRLITYDVPDDEPVNIPDYSDSTKRMNMYAYVGPTPGSSYNAYEDFRTLERYQEYKDCGFDTLLLLGNDGYSGQSFETSDLKKNLDLAQQVGLKVLVFDTRIHDLSAKTESLIGDGKTFASMDDLIATLRTYTAPYIAHPAFLGMSLKDEPAYQNFDALSEVMQALHVIDEDMLTHTVLLPYLPHLTQQDLTGAGSSLASTATFEHYKTYINGFLEKTGSAYIAYDNYPFRYVNRPLLLDSYYQNMQTVVEQANTSGAEAWLAIQSAGWYKMRNVEEDDLRYQCNSALAFGVKNIQYYTYWQFPDDGSTQGIMSHDGTKMLYDEAQRVNRETQAMARVMLNFNYEKAYCAYSTTQKPALFSNVKSETLDGAEIISVTGDTLISQMKDSGRGYTGYMVVNAADPVNNPTDTVRIRFADYLHATIYAKGVAHTVTLTDHTLEFTLESGGAIFVIPHR